MKYDAWNRLVEVKHGDLTLARYERDGLGRIIREEISGDHYFYSTAWQLLSVVRSSHKLKKDYIWGVRYVDEILATSSFDDQGNFLWRRYHIQDANWNVVTTVDPSGAALEYVTYDPYGKPTFWVYDQSQSKWLPSAALTSPEGSDFLFQGRWYQAFTHLSDTLRLYHFRNRAYGPALGRFLQADKIVHKNRYEAFAGSPNLYVDPDGLRI
ncbi:MAG: hypothetical protein DRN21_05730, partial [Thermoplasmata archaeon]